MAKLKIALYWAASCGGCEIAQLQIGDKLLKVAEAADIVFWPVALDFKYRDVELMQDGEITVSTASTTFNTSSFKSTTASSHPPQDAHQ